MIYGNDRLWIYKAGFTIEFQDKYVYQNTEREICKYIYKSV